MDMDTSAQSVKHVHVINRNAEDKDTLTAHLDEEGRKFKELGNKIKAISIINFTVKGVAAQARLKVDDVDVCDMFNVKDNDENYFGQDHFTILRVKRILDGDDIANIYYVVTLDNLDEEALSFYFSNRKEFETSFEDSMLLRNRLISGVANNLLHQRKLMKHLADHFEDDVAWGEAWTKTRLAAKSIFKKKYKQMRKEHEKHKRLRACVDKMRSYLPQATLEELKVQGYDIYNI